MRISARITYLALVFALAIGALIPLASSQKASADSSNINFLFGSGSQTGGRRITLRVQLDGAAPSGGVTVNLSASDLSVQVPSSVHVSTGQTTKEFTVPTTAVTGNVGVVITATTGTIHRSRTVLIKAATLKSLSVQSVVRHGGTARISIVLTGPAPVGGFFVSGGSTPIGILDFPYRSYVVPAGAQRLTLAVAANLFGVSQSDDRLPDQNVEVDVAAGAVSLSANTTVRDFGGDPRPTATFTETATDTATPTATSTATETPTSTNTPADTPTNTPTNTATDTPSPTSTPDPVSAACRAMNNPAFDSTYAFSGNIADVLDFSFYPGEHIEISAAAVGDQSGGIFLRYFSPANWIQVSDGDSTPYNFSLTIPGTGYFVPDWRNYGSNDVIWTVSCTPAV